MSLRISFLAVLFFFSVNGYTQNNCSRFYPISENASFTSAVYNTKADAEGDLNKVGEVTFSVDEMLDDGALYTVSISMDPMPPQQAQYKVICSEDGVSIDPSAMAGAMLSRFKDAEITGDNIYLPNDLSGPYPKSLDEAEMTINYTVGGRTMSMTTKRTNRIITGQEDIRIPARINDPLTCYVLEYDVVMSMGGMAIMTTKKKEWLAIDFGVVQSQEYDGDGNETSFSWLVDFTR